MADGLVFREMTELAALLRRRKLSAVELMEATLARIAAHDPRLHSFIHLAADAAREEAKAADRKLAEGTAGPLAGLPYAAKDLFWTAGMPTTAEMPVFQHFYPPEDATAVRRLREAGAILVGKLAMPEGAATTHHPAFGPAPLNPWGRELWTGVSSSGSGVAVAAGLVPAALGSDTGGSIRYPAAMNNVTGLMPGWGRVSRYGTVALAPSLDHMGPMARSARDVALLYQLMAGYDPKDPTSLPGKPAPVGEVTPAVLRGLRIAHVPDIANGHPASCDPEVLQALDEVAATFAAMGAMLLPRALPRLFAGAHRHAFLLIGVEAALAHAESYVPGRYGRDLRALVEAGRATDVVAYERVCRFRRQLRGALLQFFADIDLLLLPVMPYAAPTLARLGSLAQEDSPNTPMMAFTVPFNMGGEPVLTLPCRPTAAGKPLGFQLVAAPGREELLLKAGIAFQQETAWHRRHPVL